jgi:hypothetical protein
MAEEKLTFCFPGVVGVAGYLSYDRC